MPLMTPTLEDKNLNLVRLLAAERKRNGEVQSHLNRLILAQQRHIKELNKQITDLQASFVKVLADNLRREQ